MTIERIYTGVDDINNVKIYAGDKVKYTYYRCSRVSYESVHTVKWGYDEDEKKEGWILGGSLLETYGKHNNKKEKETLEVVSS
jgi:YopX protein.